MRARAKNGNQNQENVHLQQKKQTGKRSKNLKNSLSRHRKTDRNDWKVATEQEKM